MVLLPTVLMDVTNGAVCSTASTGPSAPVRIAFPAASVMPVPVAFRFSSSVPSPVTLPTPPAPPTVTVYEAARPFASGLIGVTEVTPAPTVPVFATVKSAASTPLTASEKVTVNVSVARLLGLTVVVVIAATGGVCSME